MTTMASDASLADVVSTAEARWLESWVKGPELTRWDETPVQPGDTAPDFTLPDQDGTPRRLSEWWSSGPALVVFWRHFGCGCGVERAERLRSELAAYRDAGADVVVIGQGLPVQAAAYAEEHRLDVPILTDPDLSVYRAYGLRDGTVAQILFEAPEEFWSHDRPTGESFIEGRRASGRPLVDHPWVLPGEFVVGQDGSIAHAHRYQHCEDYPEPLVLQAAIKHA